MDSYESDISSDESVVSTESLSHSHFDPVQKTAKSHEEQIIKVLEEFAKKYTGNGTIQDEKSSDSDSSEQSSDSDTSSTNSEQSSDSADEFNSFLVESTKRKSSKINVFDKSNSFSEMFLEAEIQEIKQSQQSDSEKMMREIIEPHRVELIASIIKIRDMCNLADVYECLKSEDTIAEMIDKNTKFSDLDKRVIGTKKYAQIICDNVRLCRCANNCIKQITDFDQSTGKIKFEQSSGKIDINPECIDNFLRHVHDVFCIVSQTADPLIKSFCTHVPAEGFGMMFALLFAEMSCQTLTFKIFHNELFEIMTFVFKQSDICPVNFMKKYSANSRKILSLLICGHDSFPVNTAEKTQIITLDLPHDVILNMLKNIDTDILSDKCLVVKYMSLYFIASVKSRATSEALDFNVDDLLETLKSDPVDDSTFDKYNKLCWIFAGDSAEVQESIVDKFIMFTTESLGFCGMSSLQLLILSIFLFKVKPYPKDQYQDKFHNRLKSHDKIQSYFTNSQTSPTSFRGRISDLLNAQMAFMIGAPLFGIGCEYTS